MGGGGDGGSMPGQGGNPGLLSQLMKPAMTGRGDPLGLVPELPNTPAPSPPPIQDDSAMAPQLSEDRLAFLRLFGGFPQSSFGGAQ